LRARLEPKKSDITQCDCRRLSWLVLVWLIVGAIAAFQRGYFTHAEQSCASAGTIALTVLAGPLNYVGVNPKVTDCNVPQPS
jgi:membrane protein YdbS with pleckstrin-like domain